MRKTMCMHTHMQKNKGADQLGFSLHRLLSATMQADQHGAHKLLLC